VTREWWTYRLPDFPHFSPRTCHRLFDPTVVAALGVLSLTRDLSPGFSWCSPRSGA
jgi:hypothetical protein